MYKTNFFFHKWRTEIGKKYIPLCWASRYSARGEDETTPLWMIVSKEIYGRHIWSTYWIPQGNKTDANTWNMLSKSNSFPVTHKAQQPVFHWFWSGCTLQGIRDLKPYRPPSSLVKKKIDDDIDDASSLFLERRKNSLLGWTGR